MWKSKENELNQRIYILWNDVIRRCYSEKIHKKQPCYKQCTCEEFLKLSNFVVLIKEIENDLSGNLIKIWNCAKEISEANKEDVVEILSEEIANQPTMVSNPPKTSDNTEIMSLIYCVFTLIVGVFLVKMCRKV